MQTHKVRSRSWITCHSKTNSSNYLLEQSAGTTVCLLYSSIDLPKKTIHCSISQRLLLMCLPKAFLQTFLIYYASFIGVWGTWGDEEALHLVWFSGRQQWSGDLQRWCRSFSCLPAHHLRLLMMMWRALRPRFYHTQGHLYLDIVVPDSRRPDGRHTQGWCLSEVGPASEMLGERCSAGGVWCLTSAELTSKFDKCAQACTAMQIQTTLLWSASVLGLMQWKQ